VGDTGKDEDPFSQGGVAKCVVTTVKDFSLPWLKSTRLTRQPFLPRFGRSSLRVGTLAPLHNDAHDVTASRDALCKSPKVLGDPFASHCGPLRAFGRYARAYVYRRLSAFVSLSMAGSERPFPGP